MGKASRLKKARHEDHDSQFDALRRRAINALPVPPALVRTEPSGQEKMSKILSEFAEPLLQPTKDEAGFREAISLAVIAWNLSVFPDAAQAKKTGEVLARLPSDMQAMVAMMMARKKSSFATVRRLIIDYEVIREAGEYRLNVASTNLDATLPPS
jgi:hypothetical protein